MHYLQSELHERFRTDDSVFNFLRESTLDGMWYWDLEKPENEWMSPEFWRLLGYDPEVMPHTPEAWQDIIHPEDLNVAIDNFEKHLADPAHHYDQIVRYSHKDTGDYVTVRCRGMAIRDEDGTPIRMLGAHTDLTGAKRIEEALRETNAELAEATRMAEAASSAKTMFLETMSHEIRTPMNGVLGMIEALLQTQLEPSQRKMATVISQSAQSLLVLLNDILDFSRIEAGTMSMEFSDFVPRDLIGEVAALFEQTAAEKGLELETTMGSGANRPHSGSARAVRQVLTNLVSNAIKFTPPGGQVVVSARIAEERDGSDLVLAVRDTGPGVPDDKREAIFGRFVQHDHHDGSLIKGSGLGLTIARRLCELHSGTLSLAGRTEGAGAEFTARFRLARVRDPLNAPLKGTGALMVAPDDHMRLLVAEDNELNRLVIEAMLARDGISLEFAVNGQEALNRARGGDFDAALVDIRMPVMDGIGFVQALRGHEAETGAPGLPLVACSANVLAHQVESFLEAGFGYHLPKPVTLEALNETLNWIEKQRQKRAA